MRRSLLLHPDSRCAAAESIEAEVTGSRPADLAVRYFVAGNMRDLLLPLPSGPGRADELWRHTCFELFLCVGGENAYCEFNFAPSLAWAAYRFDGYRQGMRPLEVTAPRIELRQDVRSFELQAALNLDGVFQSGEPADWFLGLSAVIEETNGRFSYWALTHAAGKPDFHHADSFALRLGAPF